VAFDSSQFDSIDNADLVFELTRSISEKNNEVNSQIPPVSNSTVLGIGTATWNFGRDTADMPYETAPAINWPQPESSGSPYHVPVAQIAQNWATHAHGNFGFVFAGPTLDFPDDLPDDNDASISWYGNFKLIVRYDPSKNPRAPQ
jgi:hypothetical protein